MVRFSMEKVRGAFLRRCGITQEVDEGRRQFLRISGAALVSAATVSHPLGSLLSAHMDNETLVQMGMESFLDRFVRNIGMVHVAVRDEGGLAVTGRFQDALSRILCAKYREFCVNKELDERYPLATTPEGAIAQIEGVFGEYRECLSRLHRVNEVLIARPDLLTEIRQRIAGNGEFNECGKFDREFSLQWLDSGGFGTRSDLEGIVRRIEDVLASFKEDCNAQLYLKFGRFLPGTTEQEAADALENARGRCEDWGRELAIEPDVKKLAPCFDDRGRKIISYLMNFAASGADVTQKDIDADFHEAIAGLMELFPTDMVLVSDGDDLRLDKLHREDRLLLIPTRLGLRISLPPGYEETQFQYLADNLEELARATKQRETLAQARVS